MESTCFERFRYDSVSTPMALPTLYTPSEVAGKLKVSRRSVYQWLISGQLSGLKAGQSWRIAEDDLIMFMRRRLSVEATGVASQDIVIGQKTDEKPE